MGLSHLRVCYAGNIVMAPQRGALWAESGRFDCNPMNLIQLVLA